MPAERSRASRRSGADGNQLVWTMPVEPVSPGGISFATNLTPITFNDPDTGVNMAGDAPESDLFPFANDPSSPRRPAHSKKKGENHIPRPPNAFILFRSSFIKRQHVSTEVETNHSTLSKIIGLTWQNLPEDERQVWHVKARAALDDHKRKFPQYAFRPLHTRSKGGGTAKRKVREVGPKDMKRCAKIAELLVEGKKGQELDAAIQEFDKYHVPEVVTRFEDPITEETFQSSPSSSTIKKEDNDREPAFFDTRSPSIRSSSKRSSRSSSVDRTGFNESRSASPGPPPLVDPPEGSHYYTVQPCTSPDICNPSSAELPSPSTLLSDEYAFSPPQDHSFDTNTFPFEHLHASAVSPLLAGSVDGDALLPRDTLSNGFSMFDEASFSSTALRPSLSIDTSYPDISAVSVMEPWTRSSSPMSASNLSIPSTPCYPDSPMPGHYNPAFSSSYTPTHGLRHTASSLSLESSSSSSSYEEYSNMYSSDYGVQSHTSVTSPFSQYKAPIYVAIGNDSTEFIDSYEPEHLPLSSIPMISCSSELDDIALAKAQAHYQYHQQQPDGLFETNFSTLLASSFSIGQ